VGVVLRPPFPRRRRLLNVVRNTFHYLLAGSLRAWLRNLGATAPALGSMTLLLLLTGLAGLSAYAMQRLATEQAADAAILHVYLLDDARQADVDDLRIRLASDNRVAAVGYTSKAEALRLAQRRPGLPDLAAAADGNPFPASLDVRVRPGQDVASLASSVRSSPAVDPIVPTSYALGSYQRIQQVLTIAAVAGGAFLLLLAFVAITVTANSIRAAIGAREQELVIMQLVGASRWMVRGPFLVEGALTGGAAGLAAAAVTLLVGLAAVAAGASVFSQVAPGITVEACLAAAVGVLAAGLALGSVASLVSVHRQLETG